jgi:hypothetical protein
MAAAASVWAAHRGHDWQWQVGVLEEEALVAVLRVRVLGWAWALGWAPGAGSVLVLGAGARRQWRSGLPPSARLHGGLVPRVLRRSARAWNGMVSACLASCTLRHAAWPMLGEYRPNLNLDLSKPHTRPATTTSRAGVASTPARQHAPAAAAGCEMALHASSTARCSPAWARNASFACIGS